MSLALSRSAAFICSLLLFTTVGFCQTALSHGILTSSQATANPFDGGALGSCEIPTTTICSVDYPVPTSIARLANIIEQSISREAGLLKGQCSDTYQTVLCNIRFPRCKQVVGSLYEQVELNPQNCSVLNDVCNQLQAPVLVGFCNNLVSATLPVNECKPVSELARNTSGEFQVCDVENMGFNVTGWMFEYMKFLDGQFIGLLYENDLCGGDLATFTCNFGGRCTENGERIEYINTHELCNDHVNCYGHDFQSLATSEVLCHLWPQEHLRPSTYTGPVLPSPDTTTVNSSITQPGGMDTTSRVTGIPLQVNSANSLRQYVLSWTIISVFTLYIISMC